MTLLLYVFAKMGIVFIDHRYLGNIRKVLGHSLCRIGRQAQFQVVMELALLGALPKMMARYSAGQCHVQMLVALINSTRNM
jgi:hypothetical protein